MYMYLPPSNFNLALSSSDNTGGCSLLVVVSLVETSLGFSSIIDGFFSGGAHGTEGAVVTDGTLVLVGTVNPLATDAQDFFKLVLFEGIASKTVEFELGLQTLVLLFVDMPTVDVALVLLLPDKTFGASVSVGDVLLCFTFESFCPVFIENLLVLVANSVSSSAFDFTSESLIAVGVVAFESIDGARSRSVVGMEAIVVGVVFDSVDIFDGVTSLTGSRGMDSEIGSSAVSGGLVGVVSSDDDNTTLLTTGVLVQLPSVDSVDEDSLSVSLCVDVVCSVLLWSVKHVSSG